MQNNTLSAQKKKLSLTFTISIFLVIFFTEIGFGIFKYIDYRNQEFSRLNMPGEFISSGNVEANLPSISPENDKDQDNIRAKFFEDRIKGGGRAKRLRPENIIIQDIATKKILFSNTKETDLINNFINLINNSKQGNGIITFDQNQYLYSFKKTNNKLNIFSFTEARITINSTIFEIGEFGILLLLASILIYFVLYRFVDRTLKPVEENIKDMEQFIYNAGHELKTPLSVIKSSLQVAKKKKENKENLEESIEEIDKMNELIESLINLSTLKDSYETQKNNLGGIMSEVLYDFDAKLKENRIKVTKNIEQDITINSNKEYLKILVRNILSNAIKYNSKPGTIKITTGQRFLEIEDSGIGIKTENIKKIFDRFFRENQARDIGGWGIGLSIVKKIIDLYSWNIDVSSEIGVGTKIKITFKITFFYFFTDNLHTINIVSL